MNEYPKYYLVENQDLIHPEIILTEKELESFERYNGYKVKTGEMSIKINALIFLRYFIFIKS